MSKIQKAVSEIKSIEELANEDRWVNQVHPLVKLCVTILYIGTVVSFSKYNLSGLLVMAVYPVILFIMNDISVKDALWRMRVVLPLVCVAGIFNPFFDRQAVMTVGQIETIVGKLMGELGTGGFMGIGDARPGMKVILIAKNGSSFHRSMAITAALAEPVWIIQSY